MFPNAQEASMEISAETKATDVFETQTCGRCGGSGHYSFNMLDGTRCYGCGGTGRKYTARGKAAKAYWEWLQTMPVELLQVGDRIFVSGAGWRKVTAITDNREEQRVGRIFDADDPEVVVRRERGAAIKEYRDGKVAVYEGVNIQTNGVGLGGERGTVRVSDPGCRVAILKSVAAYQATLTKQGKVRKASA
jgi:hypothetical protein